MDPQPLEQVVRNIDVRLGKVEQILPTLATKVELRDAIAPLATKAELREAVAPLATKAEMHDAIAKAIAPLATKAELADTKAELRSEIREEGERTRRHFDVVAERLEGHIRLVAEGLVGLREHMDKRFEKVTTDIAHLDRRVMRLEAARGR